MASPSHHRYRRYSTCNLLIGALLTTASKLEVEVSMDNLQAEEDTCSKCLKTEVIGTGNWLELGKITYENSKGKERTWESFNRITRPKTSDTDSVSILAILKRTLRRDCYILVSKFRPPVNAFTIELPSGLIREGETPANAALRQFQVETGYIGIVKFVGPPLAVDPGLSNTTMRIVTVEIDGDNAANLRQEKRSEDQDLIKVHRVPVADLLEKLIEFHEQGLIIDSKLQAFSLGLVKGAPKNQRLKPAESVDEK